MVQTMIRFIIFVIFFIFDRGHFHCNDHYGCCRDYFDDSWVHYTKITE